MFEMVSPFLRFVTNQKEEAIFLLGVRDIKNWKEIDPEPIAVRKKNSVRCKSFFFLNIETIWMEMCTKLDYLLPNSSIFT